MNKTVTTLLERDHVSLPGLTTLTCRVRAALTIAGAASVLALGASAEAQTGANVLVVINIGSTASETIGRQYAARRGVPAENVCALSLPISEAVNRDVYDAQIEQPIWKCIATRAAHDRILYIVLTKDVPIRISGTSGRTGTGASVDSELTLLYRRRTGAAVNVAGFVPNPYFAGTAAPATVEPFTHRTHDIYLVTRLDGYTIDDALAVIDRASAATMDGRFIFDKRASTVDPVPNRWLGAAAERLKSLGFDDRVVLDETGKVVTGESRVLGYYSWGSNDAAIRVRSFDFEFLPGALAGMLVGTDGRTFKEPPAAWRPSGDSGRGPTFAGTPESLMGDLIRAGATGVSGNVAEPYFDAAIRPDILFPAYASGRNLAEAFYAALPSLSWQTIIVGDPLCAPFPHASLSAEQIDPPIDALSELPAYFARRQRATMPEALSDEAAAAFMRFQTRILRNDTVRAREDLEAAIAIEPRFIPARLELAAMHERAADRDQAIAQYRAILKYSPNDPIVLNNLAYALAVYRKSPEEALPFAERANVVVRKESTLLYFGMGTHGLTSQYQLRRYDPEALLPYCLDTLAWVQHLLGRDAEAANTIREARTRARVGGPDMLWHAAVIYAAVNDMSQAAGELSAAVAADPALANRVDVQELSRQLGAGRMSAAK